MPAVLSSLFNCARNSETENARFKMRSSDVSGGGLIPEILLRRRADLPEGPTRLSHISIAPQSLFNPLPRIQQMVERLAKPLPTLVEAHLLGGDSVQLWAG